MDQKKINEIVELIKNNDETKRAFAILDEVSDFLQKDKKFFNFAGKQAKKGYVSPMEMIMLAHDYLNNTGIYAKWIENEKSTSGTKKTKEATITVVNVEKEKELLALDISKASYDKLQEFMEFFKVKGTLVPWGNQPVLIKVSEEDQMRAFIHKHNSKLIAKQNKVAKTPVKEETTIDKQVSLFDEGEL